MAGRLLSFATLAKDSGAARAAASVFARWSSCQRLLMEIRRGLADSRLPVEMQKAAVGGTFDV